TVLLRDVIQRYAIKDPKLLEDIFVYLVNTASNLFSISNIVNYFKSKNRKTTYDTVANYIGYIEDTFLIHRAERYDIKGKAVISGNCIGLFYRCSKIMVDARSFLHPTKHTRHSATIGKNHASTSGYVKSEIFTN